MGKVRGVRGATTADSNTKGAILEATQELLTRVMADNSTELDDVAAAVFTTTQDLNADFPAVAARRLGWEHVPLLCGHEMKVPDSQSRCIRVLLLVNTETAPQDIVHVYLKGAANLRARGMGDG